MPKFETKLIRNLNPIFGLIRIRMSVRSVPKCHGCIMQSASVTSSSIIQIGRWREWEMLTYVQKSSISQWCHAENEKVTRRPHADPNHRQKLITSRGSPLARACQVWSTSKTIIEGRRPFPRSSVVLFIEWQTEWSHNRRLVGGGNNKQ